jgi:hypothetical protein
MLIYLIWFSADLFRITIENIKRGEVIHLPIDSIIRYNQMTINKMYNHS